MHALFSLKCVACAENVDVANETFKNQKFSFFLIYYNLHKFSRAPIFCTLAAISHFFMKCIFTEVDLNFR